MRLNKGQRFYRNEMMDRDGETMNMQASRKGTYSNSYLLNLQAKIRMASKMEMSLGYAEQRHGKGKERKVRQGSIGREKCRPRMDQNNE